MYVRSISTERRGKFRTNRLIAVPPFKAKHDSLLVIGNTLISYMTWSKYASLNILNIPQADSILGIIYPIRLNDSFPLPKINPCYIKIVKPRIQGIIKFTLFKDVLNTDKQPLSYRILAQW